MTKVTTFATALFVSALTAAGTTARAAPDPADCHEVNLATVGWTDIAATTGLATTVLDALGYETETPLFSVPVTFVGLSSGDVDVFLGLWMPSMKGMVEKYLEDGTIDEVRANLEGAKYTIAVPAAAYETGVKSLNDLDAHRDAFGGKIYGIEPGNDGNLLIQQMIDNDAFGLGDWELIESSEAGMVLEARKATSRGEPIAFLGWAPHPMNTKMDIRYLADGDDYFGPDKGGATVSTLTRQGYAAECPNVGTFLSQLGFTLEMENAIMLDIMDNDMEPDAAAAKYLKAHPEVLDGWLKGVVTTEGKPGLPAVKAVLGLGS